MIVETEQRTVGSLPMQGGGTSTLLVLCLPTLAVFAALSPIGDLPLYLVSPIASLVLLVAAFTVRTLLRQPPFSALAVGIVALLVF
jgi:hypothetical protein